SEINTSNESKKLEENITRIGLIQNRLTQIGNWLRQIKELNKEKETSVDEGKKAEIELTRLDYKTQVKLISITLKFMGSKRSDADLQKAITSIENLLPEIKNAGKILIHLTKYKDTIPKPALNSIRQKSIELAA
ncbi:MAG: hypothetical protein ACD_79C00076G0001, partial [uncultured bacterium]